MTEHTCTELDIKHLNYKGTDACNTIVELKEHVDELQMVFVDAYGTELVKRAISNAGKLPSKAAADAVRRLHWVMEQLNLAEDYLDQLMRDFPSPSVRLPKSKETDPDYDNPADYRDGNPDGDMTLSLLNRLDNPDPDEEEVDDSLDVDGKPWNPPAE